jgi:hypothetical protein
MNMNDTDRFIWIANNLKRFHHGMDKALIEYYNSDGISKTVSIFVEHTDHTTDDSDMLRKLIDKAIAQDLQQNDKND